MVLLSLVVKLGSMTETADNSENRIKDDFSLMKWHSVLWLAGEVAIYLYCFRRQLLGQSQ